MTRKFLLIAGVASAALSGPAFAERGGNGDRTNRPQASHTISAGKAQRAERQNVQRAEHPQGVERQRIQRAERPQRAEHQRIQQAERPQHIQRAERPQRIERQSAQRSEHPQRIERQHIQQAERPQRVERQRIQRAEQPAIERFGRRQAIRNAGADFDRRRELRDERRMFRARMEAEAPRRVAALFSNHSMRPMTFRGDQRIIAIGDRINPASYSSYVPTIYRSRYVDTPDYYYRYDDDLGYLYRIDRGDNFVQGIIPLYGGYGIGDPWPMTYFSSYVPLAYQPYYYDTPNYYYRYDGYGIYRINAGTQLISGLVALLAGQGYGIGQTLPASYGVYNVPLAYRSTYYDTNNASYRYGDGFIYQVNPYNRQVAARYPLYGNDFDYLIGEPWPAAYPGYNVPLGYQSLYYDTPQYQYRYANGGIYQVEPTTQVIQALVALVSGQQFAVGQPLPAGYGMYNVPFAYRDRYYDTNDAWYRYNNGYVYQVDPRTRLIETSYPIYV